jgi:sulfonate transport system permease protein
VILWFGIGDPARLFLIALGVFFPIYINTFHGIRQVEVGLIEMGPCLWPLDLTTLLAD